MWMFLAGALVVVHLAYLAYAALGAFLGLRNARWLIPHVATAAWGVVVVAMQWDCPLTQAEKWLIARSGAQPYDGAFIDRYLFGVLFPDGSQAVLFWLQLSTFAVVYTVVLRRLLRRRPSSDRLAPL